MAIARETIEPVASRTLSLGRSKRPLVIVLSVVAAMVGLALWSVNRPSTKRSEGGGASELGLLEPDHSSAAEIHRETERRAREASLAAVALPMPSGSLPVTTGDVPKVDHYLATGAAPLNVSTGGPLEIPSDGRASAGGPPLRSFASSRSALADAHALELEKGRLDRTREALVSSSRVKAFDELRQASEQQAMDFMSQQGAGPGGGSLGVGGMDPTAALSAATAPLMAMGGLAGVGGGLGGSDASGLPPAPPTGVDPAMAQQKLSFFRTGGQQLQPGALEGEMRGPRPYELQMGSIIPGVLISGIHSESPGQIIGQVSENVYDSATGRHLLIPQGSRLVGTYSAFVSQGQSRVQVAWVRLNFPNGAALDLGGMPGADQAGRAGFEDRINRHFWRRLAAALMLSSFTVSYEVAAPNNPTGVPSAVHRGVGESLVQLGTDMARQESQIPPTLEIRAGYRFSIMVNKDIAFPGPYADGIERRVRR